MDIHSLFRQNHRTIEQRIRELPASMDKAAPEFAAEFASFQGLLNHLMKMKDHYYNHLDRDRQVVDRVLMHDLRNDHAAVVFTMESLAIRLRKNGLNPEWKKKWDLMVEVLLPHLKREEETLFPLATRTLSPKDWQTLEKEIEAHG